MSAVVNVSVSSARSRDGLGKSCVGLDLGRVPVEDGPEGAGPLVGHHHARHLRPLWPGDEDRIRQAVQAAFATPEDQVRTAEVAE